MTTISSLSGLTETRLETQENYIQNFIKNIFKHSVLLLVHMSNLWSWFYLENMVSGLGANLWGACTRNSSHIFWHITLYVPGGRNLNGLAIKRMIVQHKHCIEYLM